MRTPAPRFRPQVEPLEAREVPTAIPPAESFETVAPPHLPAGYAEWHTNANGDFVTTRQTAATGTTALASTGNLTTQSRLWLAGEQPADTGVSLKVRTDGPSAVQVIARGQGLNTTRPSYLGVVVTQGARQVQLIEVRDGAVRLLGSLRTAGGVFGQWVNVTLTPAGGSATVRVERMDTGQYLDASGAWATGAADALRSVDVTWRPAAGVVGLGRNAGGLGMVFLDDFTVIPPPAPTIRESFDATAAGGRPTDWRAWTSDGTAGFAAAAGRAVSPANGFAATGGSPTAARAWLDKTQPADVQASASLYADSLIPGSVVVRGANLDTARPTYYSATVTRGLEVKLVRVVDGAATVLGAVRSREYVSQQWVRVTLTAVGDRLRAVAFRADRQQWLTPDGEWRDTPEPAIEATDGTIPGGGLVGLARSASSAGTITFDDVEVRPASAASAPQVRVTATQPTGSVVGDVKFRATSAGGTTALRVEFRVDGHVRYAGPALPAEYDLDTTMLPNGAHELVVRAIDEAGNVGTCTVTFTVNNPPSAALPARPELPRHYSHVRIAQLAYDGNPMGAFEQARLRDSVDLVIPNVRYLGTINQAAPDTPQLVYTNLSNLYGGLLTDWLNYADRAGVSREAAFYHVTRATPHSHSSQSAQPVNWFWAAFKGPAVTPLSGQTEVAGEARGGRLRGVAFGAAGEAVALGYTDKFREVNVTLTRAAGAGWQAVYEYPSAVSDDGTPTAWRTLTPRSDGTAALTRSGQVTFDPPADWVAARYGSSAVRLFYVRVRTVAGTAAAAPEARTLLGRDYVGANGTTSGVIPAFDHAADRDGDGYLNDTEYARRTAGKDARFVYESRLFYPNYGQMRFATNPSASSVRHWAADYHARLLARTPLADGFFLDNSNGRLPIAGISVIEPTAAYNQDFAGMVASVWRAIAPKLVVSNTAGGWADADPVARASTGVLEEFLLRPMDANWAAVADVAALVASRLSAGSPPPYTILDTHAGGFATTDPRLRSAALAYYYLVGDPDRTMLMFFGGNGPSAAWANTWIPAVSTDIGRPAGAMTTFATGADPENPALAYRVLRRDYGNAVVLYKPRSYTLGKTTGTLNDATATTHDLGGNYRVLNPDGTQGPVMTRVTLRNGEGVVLMRA